MRLPIGGPCGAAAGADENQNVGEPGVDVQPLTPAGVTDVPQGADENQNGGESEGENSVAEDEAKEEKKEVEAVTEEAEEAEDEPGGAPPPPPQPLCHRLFRLHRSRKWQRSLFCGLSATCPIDLRLRWKLGQEPWCWQHIFHDGTALKALCQFHRG